jgi:hypothetical protein
MKVLNYLMKIDFMQSVELKAAEFPRAYIERSLQSVGWAGARTAWGCPLVEWRISPDENRFHLDCPDAF